MFVADIKYEIINADFMGGVQLGAFNRSYDFVGLQIGLINFTRHLQGVQLGLWNISERRSTPFVNWQF